MREAIDCVVETVMRQPTVNGQPPKRDEVRDRVIRGVKRGEINRER
jgi:hypothetical protein